MSNRVGTYSQIRATFALYWNSYGGWRALAHSPYLHLAIFLTILFSPGWVGREWWINVLQVLPNIVGFSIGGYAIWLGFGDEKFKAIIAGSENVEEISPYMEVSATFCHFVVVQLTAIIFALGGSAMNFDGSKNVFLQWIAGKLGTNWGTIVDIIQPIGGAIGSFLFFYALTTALAAVFAIFHVANWFDQFRTAEAHANKKAPKP